MREFFDELTKGNRGLFLLAAGNVYVGIGDAQKAIHFLADRGVVILGFEGFTTDGVHLQASVDYIADLTLTGASAEARVKESAENALRILESWSTQGGPAFVEFVVESPKSRMKATAKERDASSEVHNDP